MHIAELYIIMRIGMVCKSHEKTVLIECIVQDLLSKIHVNFIIYNKGKVAFFNWFAC